jgi:hypothetical protein
MKPGFALSLSFEGIALLQRAAGGWRSVGEVSLEATDLAGELAGLRDKAKAYGPDELYCKIIIPNDQIRYLNAETGSFSGEARLGVVRAALEGATPYPVDDLVFDLAVDGSVTQVAAVARETLAEAEAFAVEHGFNPLCFVAAPDDNPFLGEPFFGASAFAATLPGTPTIERDGIAVVVVGLAIPMAVETALQPEPAAQPEPEPAEQPADGGFSSRRKRKSAEPATTSKQSPGSVPLGGAERAVSSRATDKPAPAAIKSEKSDTDDEPAATAPKIKVPEPISVTAPTLDVAEATDEDSLATNPAGPAEVPSEGGFLSRRKKAGQSEPSKQSKPVPVAAPIPRAPAPIGEPKPAAHPELTAVSRPSDPGFADANTASSPEDEANKMTVFGARDQARVGGKPRHLGLILSAALLLFLVAIAAWASIFLENGVAGLFRASPADSELAATPQAPETGTEQVTATTGPTPEISEPAPPEPTTLALLPPANLDVPGLPPPRRLGQPDQPATPDLSDTDSAVLDALRQPVQADPQEDQEGTTPAIEAVGDPVAEQIPDLSPDPATVPDTDLARENQAAVAYAATGILQNAPQVPETPSIIGLDDLYVASIDRTDLAQDAVALPTVASLVTDLPLGAVGSPVAAGTEFALGPGGLVEATVEGTLNPGGVMVFLGRPAAVPPAIPARLATGTEIEAAPEQLASRRPRLRPNDLEERFERTNLGGLTRQELGGRRPKARPESRQEQAKPGEAPTAQAVVVSRRPSARPGDFAAIVSAAVRPTSPDNPQTGAASPAATAAAPTGATATPAAVAVAKPSTAAPNIPTSASVARSATLRHEINVRRVNLIGVYGTPSNRRALVRLPSGRYKKVKVGDSVDGGRVVAIGDSELRYQKRGRNLTLKIPSS